MRREQIKRAWDLNEVWVKRRYPDLDERQLARLREIGMIPRATGELVAGPHVVLDLLSQIASLRTKINRRQRGGETA